MKTLHYVRISRDGFIHPAPLWSRSNTQSCPCARADPALISRESDRNSRLPVSGVIQLPAPSMPPQEPALQNYFALESEAAHIRIEREHTAAQEHRASAAAKQGWRLRWECRHLMGVCYSRMVSRSVTWQRRSIPNAPHFSSVNRVAEST